MLRDRLRWLQSRTALAHEETTGAGVLQVCNSDKWTDVYVAPPPPSFDCKGLYDDEHLTASKVYNVDCDGTGVAGLLTVVTVSEGSIGESLSTT